MFEYLTEAKYGFILQDHDQSKMFVMPGPLTWPLAKSGKENGNYYRV